MNKLFIRIVLVTCIGLSVTEVSEAQNRYQKFEWDIIQLGYVPKRGGAIGSEVRYNIRNDFSVGYALQVHLSDNTDDQALKFKASRSHLLLGDYYFNKITARRLFSGLGLGYFEGGAVEYGTWPNGQDYHTGTGGRGFGIAPRVGYELGHFRVKAQYNVVFNRNISNFFDLSVAFTLGGAIKK